MNILCRAIVIRARRKSRLYLRTKQVVLNILCRAIEIRARKQQALVEDGAGSFEHTL